MLTQSEIDAILYLLDDTDEGVVTEVENRLYSEGPDIVPALENYWEANHDPVRAFRIENIIKNIQQDELSDDFRAWMSDKNKSLLQANLLISRIQYPGLNVDMVHKYIEKLRLDVWMAMYSAQNPIDKIQIMNHVFFERHGLKGNTVNYHSPDNSFINRAIESRQANPITLSNIYSIVAQQLGLPVFGVNLPQHFVLAFCEDSTSEYAVPFTNTAELNRNVYGKVLFYINPFSKGQIFLKKNIDEFLKLIKVEPQKEFYEPCDNAEILKRMLRNLHFAYSEIKNTEKQQLVERYMRILGMLSDMDTNDENMP